MSSDFVIRDYNRLLQSAELRDIKLVASSFLVTPQYFSEDDHPLELVLSDKHGAIDFDNSEMTALTNFEWTADCKRGEHDLLNIRASYIIIYQFSEEVEKKYVEAFFENVGRFAVYPYFRALVGHYSSASSANLPILPIIKQPISASTGDHEDNRRKAKRTPRRGRRTDPSP